jgi:hypothetical protein
MKLSKTKKNTWLYSAIVLLAMMGSAYGQGTIIAQHSGANDPTTEGFGSYGTGQAGGVINDLGSEVSGLET